MLQLPFIAKLGKLTFRRQKLHF